MSLDIVILSVNLLSDDTCYLHNLITRCYLLISCHQKSYYLAWYHVIILFTSIVAIFLHGIFIYSSYSIENHMACCRKMSLSVLKFCNPQQNRYLFTLPICSAVKFSWTRHFCKLNHFLEFYGAKTINYFLQCRFFRPPRLKMVCSNNRPVFLGSSSLMFCFMFL
jgi:hypothetical protein